MDSRWDSNPGLVKTAGIVLVLKCSAVFEGCERRPRVSRRPRRRRKRRHRRRYDCSRLRTFHKGLNVTHRDALSFIFSAASPSTRFYGSNFFLLISSPQSRSNAHQSKTFRSAAISYKNKKEAEARSRLRCELRSDSSAAFAAAYFCPFKLFFFFFFFTALCSNCIYLSYISRISHIRHLLLYLLLTKALYLYRYLFNCREASSEVRLEQCLFQSLSRQCFLTFLLLAFNRRCFKTKSFQNFCEERKKRRRRLIGSRKVVSRQAETNPHLMTVTC